MAEQMDDVAIEQNPVYPRQAYKAGFWLIAAIPLVLVIMFSLNAWIHRQSVVNMVGVSLVLVIIVGAAYNWSQALLRRSGWDPNWRTGLAGVFGLLLAVLGVEFGGYDLLFGNLMKVFRVMQTVSGTRPEFYVVFITWTGLVTASCGFAIGVALQKPRLSLALLGLGFITGSLAFTAVALLMEVVGFRVGTLRPDGLPSMPIVTILGIWAAALAGSEVFGRVLNRHR